MKILVISQSYPSQDNLYSCAFVHTRTLHYMKKNVEVDVISFEANEDYIYEDVQVYKGAKFLELLEANEYEAVVCHAPNLRNHLRVLYKSMDKIEKLFFIFHGHEILDTRKYYRAPYPFQRTILDYLSIPFRSLYDFAKRKVLKAFIQKYAGSKLKLVFVSEYLRSLFEENVGIPSEEFATYSTVIHNPISDFAIDNQYDFGKPKHLGFITIRPFDKSVYAIDIMMKFAKKNPFEIFYIYGFGEYFKHNSCPVNVKVVNRFLTRDELPEILNKYRAAIMLSTHDTQGVMMCEMAAFGIPLIVSDTPAAREMLSDVKNVIFIDNKAPDYAVKEKLKEFKKGGNAGLIKKLSGKNTSEQELKFFKDKMVSDA